MMLSPSSHESSAIIASLTWLQDALAGPVATAVAVLAIAAIGFMLIQGRVDLRRATRAVLGCFLVFGAATIASGIITALEGNRGTTSTPQAVSPAAISQLPQAEKIQPYDPYAGAAVPQR